MADPRLSSLDADQRAKRNVLILSGAQALLGSQVTMIFVIGGLAGMLLAPNPCLGTLPISMIVFGSMTTAPWLSAFMQRNGRTAGLWLGSFGGFLGSGICALALVLGNFPLFLLGSYCTGIYVSSQGFFRFAATDTASPEYKPKAISYVLAGGLASAVIGPQIAGYLSIGNVDATATRYLGVYIAAMGINVIGALLFLGLDIPHRSASETELRPPQSRRVLLRTPAIVASMIVGAVSYSLMSLVMTSTPIAVVACGYRELDASGVVSAHVLAMFGPSFFTGHLIARFGAERIAGAGLFLLTLAGAVALMGVELANFYVALILLGLGWNFGLIGATAMLEKATPEPDRNRVQGLNELIVYGAVTVASLASGGLLNCSGGEPIDGWALVNWAMIPFVILAFGTLAWLAHRQGSARAQS